MCCTEPRCSSVLYGQASCLYDVGRPLLRCTNTAALPQKWPHTTYYRLPAKQSHVGWPCPVTDVRSSEHVGVLLGEQHLLHTVSAHDACHGPRGVPRRPRSWA